MSKLFDDLGQLYYEDSTVYTIYNQCQKFGGESDYETLLLMVKTLSKQKQDISKTFESYVKTDVRPMVLYAKDIT